MPPAKTPAPSSNTPKALPPRQRDAIILSLFAILWLACSVIPSYSYIFPEGRQPRMAGPDAYFHLRHTEAVLAHYPVIERFDLMTNFPDGEIGLNQGFFDVAMATISKITGLAPVLVLAWVSPFLMVSTGIWCYFWLSRGVGWRCGALFLLFLVLYPGPLNVLAALGQGDHHAAEVFLALAVAWSLDRLLASSTSWRWAPLAALPMVLFYLSWAGTALHLLLAGAVFYVRAWKPRETHEDKDLTLKGCLYGLTLLFFVAAIGRLLPWAVIWETSQRVFYVGSISLALGYPVLVALTRRQWRRPWLAALALLLVPLAIALAVPTTRALVFSLFEERTQQVSEHVAISFQTLVLWYGLFWMAALLAPLKLWRDKALWPALVPLVYGGGIIVFWLQTRDFNYYPPPVIAAAAAYVLAGLNPGWGLVLAAALFVLPPFLPKSGVQQPWMTTKMIRETMMQTDGLEEAAEWLKQTQGSITPDSPEAYGLVTPWDLGNIIAQSSKNPVRWSQTVSPELANLLFTDQPDETYKKITSMKRPLRYLVIPARNLAEKFLGEMLATKLSLNEMLQNGPTVDWNGLKVVLMVPTARSSATLLARLYWGLARDLGHYRLVYESPSQSIHATKLLPESSQLEFVSFPVSDKTMPIFQPLLGQVDKPLETSRGVLVNARLAPEVRIFEAVPGALLTGTAKPTSQVVAKVGIVDPANGSLRVCTYTALANSEGRFELRVPYPTDVAMSPAAGTIKVQGPYEVVIGEQVRQVEVKEEEIKQGKELPL